MTDLAVVAPAFVDMAHRIVWATAGWQMFKEAPQLVGYDPAIVPPWKDGPTSPAFVALRLQPWRLRVMPGTSGSGGRRRDRKPLFPGLGAADAATLEGTLP